MSAAPHLSYWHVLVGPDGRSTQRRCTIEHWREAPIQPGTAPQWMGPRLRDDMTVTATVLPAGWTGDWHENPAPQWIVPLSGGWFVETMDGTRTEMGPGDLSFGADQGCREEGGHKGHLSGTVGAAPCVLLLVQMENGPDAGRCPFR